MRDRKALLIVIFSGLIVLISMGVRQSLGLFLAPITGDLGIGRESFSLAMALHNLLFGLPLLGILADRYGARWILVLGGLFYGAGFLIVSALGSPGGLFLGIGVLTGLALSGSSYVVVLGAVAQVIAPARRSTVFGMVTAAGSFGMFALIPGAQWLLERYSWQGAFVALAGLVGLISLLGLGFPVRSAKRAGRVDASEGFDSLAVVLSKARTHSGYLLLVAGFFVCGFHVAFIATHMPAFLTDNGISGPVSATALSLIGIFNIFGSLAFGRLGDRYRKKYLLSLLYGLRAVVLSLFLLLPLTNTTAILFGGAIGFLWLATVPLTSGTVAQIFGSRYLSTLYGIVFLSHQIGAFFGVWLGGRIYDSTGSYTIVWLAAIALSVIATLIHLPITDQPYARTLQPQVAAETV
ncbi:MAG: MFS transporter [Caldilineaceae bacterium]|nr:MFS transporter [Caldilineaceae bacterium]HRJ41548.1 MFS transporter [Caldilineaceae bacterium]